jgi:hypothetical protein
MASTPSIRIFPIFKPCAALRAKEERSIADNTVKGSSNWLCWPTNSAAWWDHLRSDSAVMLGRQELCEEP